VDGCGPPPGNQRWPCQQGLGFDLASFQIDWEAKQAQCPGGKHRAHWRPPSAHRGHAVVNSACATSDCSPGPHLRQCTTATGTRRSLRGRVQAVHAALQAARQRAQTEECKAHDKKRAGIEGTIAQGVRAFGLRRSRYLGQANTALQQIAMAAAINLVRLGAWWEGMAPGTTRVSAFARVMRPVAACERIRQQSLAYRKQTLPSTRPPASALWTHSFRGAIPRLRAPLPTSRLPPHGDLRTARGRCGSLDLHRRRFPLPTPCQSPGKSGRSVTR
jgi:hypothetical protein